MLVTSTLIPVFDEHREIGHIVRCEHSVEAFNANDISLGLFPDEREAAIAIWRQRNLKMRCDHDGSLQNITGNIGAAQS